jgi:DNA-binding transcriptional LysR family regulator
MARSFDLRLLNYFVTVAEQRNITRAADRLGVAQPALSQQIRLLEERLGTRLLDRHPAGITLTRAGQVLLERARELLSAADSLATSVRQAARGRHRTLQIGLTTSASLHDTTAELLRRVVARHDDLFLEIREANAQTLSEQLIDGRLDLVILRAEVMRRASLVSVVLDDEAVLVALPASRRPGPGSASRQKGRKRLTLRELQNEDFILVRRPGQPGLYEQWVQACLKEGFEPRIVAEVPRMLTCLNMVAAGIGISMVPASLQSVLARHIHCVPCTGLEALRAPLTLLHRKSEHNMIAQDFVAEATRLGGERRTNTALI